MSRNKYYFCFVLWTVGMQSVAGTIHTPEPKANSWLLLIITLLAGVLGGFFLVFCLFLICKYCRNPILHPDQFNFENDKLVAASFGRNLGEIPVHGLETGVGVDLVLRDNAASVDCSGPCSTWLMEASIQTRVDYASRFIFLFESILMCVLTFNFIC
ncbi:hypothetical protein Ciccas_005559 [Cichlidogyrus casuarinus]|uniref:Uncharacterized protein n=1 Tax=Cichlidogyrus casuarinus TaxID=1844966 RepID=A0ABD2Q8B2_9PLAT